MKRKISWPVLSMLLDFDDLQLPEIKIFQIALNWVIYHKPEKEIIDVILEKIRLPLIHPKDLVKYVKPSKLVSSLDYIEAMEYNADPSHFDLAQKKFKPRMSCSKALSWETTNGKISFHNNLITATTDGTVRSTEPVYPGYRTLNFTVISTDGWFGIGIAKPGESKVYWAGPNKSVWGISANGYSWEDGQGKTSSMGKLGTGSKISVVLDSRKGQIRFKVGKNVFTPTVGPSEQFHVIIRLQKSSVEWSQE